MADDGPYDELAPTALAPISDARTARPPWRSRFLADVGIAAGAVLVNGAAFTWVLFHLISRFQHQHPGPDGYTFLLGSDLGQPLVGWVWFQCVLNGLVLALPSRTRALGLGILLAAGLVALAVVGWVALVIATW